MLLFLLVQILHVSVASELQVALIIGAEVEDGYNFLFVDGKSSDSLSFGIPLVSIASFNEKINETGWSTLSVISSRKFPDAIQAYWSGYLETNVTYSLTEAHMQNMLTELCPKPFTPDCEKLQVYLSQNIQSMIEKAIKRANYDAYWYQVYLQLWQVKGIADAYGKKFISMSASLNHAHLRTLEKEVMGIYLLQILGDIPELLSALKLTTILSRRSVYGEFRLNRPSCSALIKLVPNDLYASHVTWSGYVMMLRVLKHYNFPWKTTNKTDPNVVPGHTMSFSSYPSMISSMDDFYVLSSGLVALETTIGNDNDSLWEYVRENVDHVVLEPFRVNVANRLARSGGEWVTWFAHHNCGTYNNQWMIVDSKLFTPGKPLPDKGVLTVAEQLPGIVVSDDVTSVLKEQTYWASYNLPFFPQIYNMSGTAAQAAKYGDWFDYKLTARAQIFRRDHKSVTNLAQMHRLMRYNNFQHDPLSRCSCSPPYTAENAISSRNDLNDPMGTYPIASFGYRLHGGTDVKIVNSSMIKTLNIMATSGPSYSNMPPFKWSALPIPVAKPALHPDKWMFTPIITSFDDYGPNSRGGAQSGWYGSKATMIPVF